MRATGLLVFLPLSLSSCSTLPPDNPYGIALLPQKIDVGARESIWSMDNVAPEEGVTITEGRARPFSVDVKIAIPYNVDETYMVTYASGGIAHHPFRVHFSDTLGTTQFSGKITWYDDVCGQEKTITLALYRLEATPTGRVEEKTLLKEIQRRYDIRCDRSQFALFRFAKETLGLCKDI